MSRDENGKLFPERVTDSCWLEYFGSSVFIGDDIHMNGLDAPATLRSPDDARALIAVLNVLIEKWPCQTT